MTHLLTWARWASASLALCLSAQSPLDDGLAALRRNDTSAAIEALQKAPDSDPRKWIALARARQLRNEPKPALEAAARAEALGSPEALITQGLAIFHAEGGRALEAERYAARATPLLTTEQAAALRNLLGKALFAARQPAAAISHLEAATRLNAYQEAYYADLVNALLRQQRFADALTAIEPSRKIFASSAQLELMAGVAYYGLRRFPDAVDSFLKVTAAAPGAPQAYLFLNRMLPQAEPRLPEVRAAFDAFAARFPDSHLSPFLRARVHPQPAEAEKLLRQSLARKEDHAEAHFELGLLLEKRRDYPAAAQSLARAAGLRPNDSATYYRLARLYDRLNEPTKAAAARATHARLVEAERANMGKHGENLPNLTPP